MMRIAIDVQSLLAGRLTGIGYYQYNLVKEMLESDTQNEYVLNFFSMRNTEAKISALREMFGEKVDIRPCRWFSYSLAHRLWLIIPFPYRWFMRQKADATLFFNYYVPPFADGRVYSVVYDTVVADMPDTMDKRTRTVLKLTLKKSMKRSDTVITISGFSKNQIMRHFGVAENNIFVAPCGVNHERFNTRCSAVEIDNSKKRYGVDGKYILYLGTLEPRKNITGLIEAYKLLTCELPECPKLVISGGKGWLYEAIFEKVRQLELENQVIFTGYVSDEDAPLLMSGAELFCFPSFYEGFGMPPLEAMACGVPTVVSDRTALPDIVADGALTVNPDSAEDIFKAMRKILTDENLKRKLTEKGISRAGEYTWKNTAEMLIQKINNN